MNQALSSALALTVCAIRMDKGKSLCKLAADIDVPLATLSRIQDQVGSPTLATVEKVCAGLGISALEALDYDAACEKFTAAIKAQHDRFIERAKQDHVE